MIPQHHLPADIERTSLSIITAELEALAGKLLEIRR